MRAASGEVGSGIVLINSGFGSGTHVVEYVHEVDVGIIWAVIGAEVLVDIPIGPVFGAHVVEMVAGRQLPPAESDASRLALVPLTALALFPPAPRAHLRRPQRRAGDRDPARDQERHRRAGPRRVRRGCPAVQVNSQHP